MKVTLNSNEIHEMVLAKLESENLPGPYGQPTLIYYDEDRGNKIETDLTNVEIEVEVEVMTHEAHVIG